MDRRRKLNQKGRKKVVAFVIKGCLLLIVLAGLVRGIFGFALRLGGESAREVSGELTAASSLADESAAGAQETQPEVQLSDEEMQDYISSHKELYPKSLRKFCKTYPQTLEFVYDYPEKKDLTPEIDLTGDYVAGQIPLFIQWDERWGYAAYGDSLVGTAGCGPTCLSMVYVGLTGDLSWNPRQMAAFAEENGYYTEESGTSWELMGEGAKKLGLTARTVAFSKAAVKKELKKGRPVIVSVSEGEFTTTGHFIVLTGLEDGKFIVNDPNSRENSEKRWEWSEFCDQIKNLWSYSVQ